MIGAAIRAVLQSGTPASAQTMRNRPEEAKMRDAIDRVLLTRSTRGGHRRGAVALLDIHGTTVFLQMKRLLQGCASASVTVREGVEKTLRQKPFPGWRCRGCFDHAAGPIVLHNGEPVSKPPAFHFV